ncbi:PREDICTED: myosin-binding protein 3-like isoform X3 [Nicotiana attenuata]|uniref:myosin-binding protein 3-like isoform X2 n=1 Tax=Nicotiana attenuata TaxID=49451 RepID=UPI0009057EDD|nr:PREDICTED: myosin-binding protein 3-like isoform X2 [Nicotiana attenuata]XP_019267295.1 PREDICTED: myosin-binding protein 3-like isoform X3 [Nicotiana attenuata]
MAARGISSGKQRNPRGFMTVLSSAACEWFLIFMLFLDAALSYMITKFASYYELQTPCMLCSRFDQIFGNKKIGCYRRLLCRNHKEEISFQVFCHVHGNLADVRAMCEECLVSFATENVLVKESDNLMMAKLGNKSFIPSSPGPWSCSCCHKTWRARSSAQRLLQLTSVGFGASKANVKPPLPRAPGRSRFSRRDSFKKIRDKISGPDSPRARTAGVDPLSHVGYTELKITSDSESEIQISDDDDGCSATRGKNDSRSEDNGRSGKGITQKVGTEAATPENQVRQSSESRPSLLDPPMQLAASSGKNVCFRACDDFVGHGLAELDWENLSPKASPSVMPELISLDNITQSPNILENHHTSGVISQPNIFLPRISDLSVLSELISATNLPSSSSINIQETNLTEATDEGNNITVKTNAKAPVDLDDSAPSIPNQIQADISALSYRERKVSDRHGEPSAISDAGKAGEGMKSLPQLSTSEMDGNQTASHRNNDHGDDHQRSDASSSDGVRLRPKSTFVERDDSGNEPADGFSINEIEGESIVDRLKRQVEHDQRCINALYKELEEERSASAIAANQAMAMITRLQEEKASLHMEALQYLRMMEEQAEYDMEALERANDLLAEREKELQDLEAELELFRNNYTDELAAEDPGKEDKNQKGEKVMTENNSLDHIENKLSGSSDSKTIKISKNCDKPREFNDSICNFEDEKLRISQHLKNLEKKLFQVSGRQVSDNVPYNGYSERIEKDVDDHVKKKTADMRSTNSQQEESSSSTRNDFPKSNGGSTDKPADLGNGIVSEDKNNLDIKHKKVSSLGGEIDVAAMGNEISELNGRLQALENDCNFLMHAFNSLQNGHEGIQFIQEIAHRLQEIRKIEIKTR